MKRGGEQRTREEGGGGHPWVGLGGVALLSSFLGFEQGHDVGGGGKGGGGVEFVWEKRKTGDY